MMKKMCTGAMVAMAAFATEITAHAVGITHLVEPTITRAAAAKPAQKAPTPVPKAQPTQAAEAAEHVAASSAPHAAKPTTPAPHVAKPAAKAAEHVAASSAPASVAQKPVATAALKAPARPQTAQPESKNMAPIMPPSAQSALSLLPPVPTASIVAQPLTEAPLPSPVIQKRLLLQATSLAEQGKFAQAKRTVRSLNTDPARDITAAVAALQNDHATVVGLLYPVYYYHEHEATANQGLYTLAKSLVAMRERTALNALLNRRQDILETDAELAQKVAQLR